MDTEYRFWCELTLSPVADSLAQDVKIMLDQDTQFHGDIVNTITLDLDTKLSAGWHDLCIHYRGKSDLDEKSALKILRLEINGISDPRFIWNAVYRPDYPRTWFQQQQQAGIILAEEFTSIDYLGWNGEWTLRFHSPVYTWIHQIQNLGWIYD